VDRETCTAAESSADASLQLLYELADRTTAA
jgi:hypothetical protein